MKVLNPKAVKFVHKSKQFAAVPLLSSNTSKGGTKQVFLDVTMTKRHKGLWHIARLTGINPMELKHEDFLLFLNPSASYIALIEAGGRLTYLNRKFGADLADVVREYPMPIEAKKFLIGFLNQKKSERKRVAELNRAQQSKRSQDTASNSNSGRE